MDNDQNYKEIAANNMKQAEQQMKQISYANEYNKNMENIYNDFLKKIGKTPNETVTLTDDQVEMLIFDYSKYLLPKMYYYILRGTELSKESIQKSADFQNVFGKLCEQLYNILYALKKNNNTMDNNFYNNYIKLDNGVIMSEFLKVYDNIGNLDNKKEVERRISYLLSLNLKVVNNNTILQNFVKEIILNTSNTHISIVTIFEKHLNMIETMISFLMKKSQ